MFSARLSAVVQKYAATMQKEQDKSFIEGFCGIASKSKIRINI